MGTQRPRGTETRREGADQHQNKQLPLSIHPCCQVSPCWLVSGGSLSPTTPVAIPPQPPSWHRLPDTTSLGGPCCPQGMVDTHSRPGASLACGSASASSPPSFASRAGRPPPGSSSPWLPPAWLALSVHPVGLSAPVGWPALPSVSGNGDPGRGHSNPSALGVPWHHSPALALLQGRVQGTPLLPEPSCQLGTA